MTVTNELIDILLANYKKPENLIGQNDLLKQLTKKLVERALEAEVAQYLGHAKNQLVANAAGNTRNGKSSKTLKGDFGELPIEIPRDRQGSVEPQIVTKYQTRWVVFDDKILSLYARGMTVREIQSHLQEMYGAEVSPTLISSVTDAVMDEAQGLAGTTTECAIPLRLPGLYPRQNPLCRCRARQSRALGPGRQYGRRKGDFESLDCPDRWGPFSHQKIEGVVCSTTTKKKAPRGLF